MPLYQLGKQWWFAELGRTPDVGEVVELPEHVAARYMHNEPGLLAPARKTTQAKPKAARGRKPRK